MITIATRKSFPETPKKDDEDGQTKENDETVEPVQAPPAFKKGARHSWRSP